MQKLYKYILFAAVYIAMVGSSVAQQAEAPAATADAKPEIKTDSIVRDPFSPSSGQTIQRIPEDSDSDITSSGTNPLTSGKINGFKVVGVMIAENKKVAAVKAVNGLDFIVQEGDEIGNDGGRITEIKFDGIIVSSSDGKIFIPVSNKIEVAVDKKS